jgi:hypothetical protein
VFVDKKFPDEDQPGGDTEFIQFFCHGFRVHIGEVGSLLGEGQPTLVLLFLFLFKFGIAAKFAIFEESALGRVDHNIPFGKAVSDMFLAFVIGAPAGSFLDDGEFPRVDF